MKKRSGLPNGVIFHADIAKSAFHVIKPEIAELIRIHAMVANRSPLKVAMFEHYQAAARWLGVPLTRLQAGV